MRFLIACLFALPAFAHAGLIKKTVEYKDAKGDVFEGYLVYPDAKKAKFSGVLMIHDWLGMTDKVKGNADRVAELGYAVFAADIYGKKTRPKDQGEAGKTAGMFKGDRKLFRERLNLGLQTMEKQPIVDTSKVGAIGYCFGGTGVIELARSGAKVATVISVHGGLDSPTPADGKNIKARVLALHGADDPFVPAKDVEAFAKEMRDHKIDWELVSYGGAVHGFTDKSAGTDNSKGMAYNERADKRSFEEIQRAFEQAL